MEKLTVKIPDGCKSLTIEQFGGNMVMCFEPVVTELRCYELQFDGKPEKYQVITSNIENKPYIRVTSNRNIGDNGIFVSMVHNQPTSSVEITRERIQEVLSERGYMFDFENKTLLPYKWRTNKGGTYYCVGANYEPIQAVDVQNSINNTNYELGDYFQTYEECYEVCQEFIKMLKNK